MSLAPLWESKLKRAAAHGGSLLSKLVEQYRTQLGYEPWDSFAKRMREQMQALAPGMTPAAQQRSLHRRTGRTTRGIVCAIAGAVIAGNTTIVVRTKNDAHTKWVTDQVKITLERLNIQHIKVREFSEHAAYGPQCWIYEDHTVGE